MLPPLTVDQVIARLGARPSLPVLPTPPYEQPRTVESQPRVGFAVKSMEAHTTDEGAQIFNGLEAANYRLAGHGYRIGMTDVDYVVMQLAPHTVVLQDVREWDVPPGDFRDPRARFRNYESLQCMRDVFRIGVLKDAHQRPDYHRRHFEQVGYHALVVYYHPRIVKHLAPYVRTEHLIRTYHSLDPAVVPAFDSEGRRGAILSGAISKAYPLRERLRNAITLGQMKGVDFLPHPGYGRGGCATPAYLRKLSRYKVSICTASKYGYLLRKIAESTACGCRVLTDLPVDEKVPFLEKNILRVHPDESLSNIEALVHALEVGYNPSSQKEYAEVAKRMYDYCVLGRKLADDIEALRKNYHG